MAAERIHLGATKHSVAVHVSGYGPFFVDVRYSRRGHDRSSKHRVSVARDANRSLSPPAWTSSLLLRSVRAEPLSTLRMGGAVRLIRRDGGASSVGGGVGYCSVLNPSSSRDKFLPGQAGRGDGSRQNSGSPSAPEIRGNLCVWGLTGDEDPTNSAPPWPKYPFFLIIV